MLVVSTAVDGGPSSEWEMAVGPWELCLVGTGWPWIRRWTLKVLTWTAVIRSLDMAGISEV